MAVRNNIIKNLGISMVILNLNWVFLIERHIQMNISEDLLRLVNNQFYPDLNIYGDNAGPLTVKLPLFVGMLIGNCCI